MFLVLANDDVWVGVGEVPLYPVHYAISLDRPRLQRLGTLHNVSSSKARKGDGREGIEGGQHV
jgi:hypothetical protein